MPELVGAKSDWIQKPTSLKALRGKVVLVDFWEYTCVNCVRTFPYLNKWYQRYKDKGFEVVAVHTPEFEFDKDPKNVRAAAKRFGFTFPVLNDPNYLNWNNFGVEGWPTKILLNPQGVGVWLLVGEGDYAKMEQHIQKELRKLNPKVQLPPILAPIHDADQPGAVCHPKSQEFFAGWRGLRDSRVPYAASQVGGTALFSYPVARKQDILYLAGAWSPRRDYITATPGAGLKIKYAAKEVNAVLHPGATPVEVEVLQDGAPVAAADLGEDVRLVNGRAVMKVDQPKMYSVLNNAKWGRRELEFRVKGPGLRLYTFSYSTDCMYVYPQPKPKRSIHGR
ncbi:MAG: hypothetical protein QOJ65_1926 [Fimbriimonadaceae bacterium]|nr:hypothetical protein [Fimbriimonadaceae bacterium]